LSYYTSAEEKMAFELRKMITCIPIIYFRTDDLYTVQRVYQHEELGFAIDEMDARPRFIQLTLRFSSDYPWGFIEYLDNPERASVMYAGPSSNGCLSNQDSEAIRLYLEHWLLGNGEKKTKHHIVLYGMELDIPAEIESYVGRIEVPRLSPEDLRKLLDNKLPETTLDWYRKRIGGFERYMVEQVSEQIRGINFGMVGFDGNDSKQKEKIDKLIRDYKIQRLKNHNKLECMNVDKHASVKGQGNIDNWIEQYRKVFSDSSADSNCKGMMLVGIPGTGKTAAAVVIAQKLDLPLVKLNVGKLLGRYVGESEHNLREALDDLQFCAPCVVLFDEIEKGLSGASSEKGSGDNNGVMDRIVGDLLDFTQRNQTQVFMVATANDITALKPEMIRNERFDARFYLQMPTYSECLDIMQSKICDKTGEPKKSEALAKALLPVSIGLDTDDKEMKMKDIKRFLTGADITTLIQKLSILVDLKTAEESNIVCKLRNNVLPFFSAYGERSAVDNIRQIARCYRIFLDRALTPASSNAKHIDFHPEKITRFYVPEQVLWREKKPGENEELKLPTSMDMKKLLDCEEELNQENMHDGYDSELFRVLRKAMDNLLLEEAPQSVFNSYMSVQYVIENRKKEQKEEQEKALVQQ